MPTVDRADMLNLARRMEVGLVVHSPDGVGKVRYAQVDCLLHVVRTNSRRALMWYIGGLDKHTSKEPGSCYRRPYVRQP